MGLGGYLTWTAVARELVQRSGIEKVFPFEQHGQLIRPIKSDIFKNNPYISQDFNNERAIPLQLNSPQSNYCKQDTPERAVHRYDKHIIEQICEIYGINDPKLKCELYFDDEEIHTAENLVGDLVDNTNGFIVIEPQSNDEYTVNKRYPLSKWQYVADELIKDGHVLVQIGRKTKDQKLSGVIDITGKTTFREAAAIISLSNMFVSSEGGLMHAANAVGTESVILYTGFIHPTMTCYSENTNIWIGRGHGPCGLKVHCQNCYNESLEHDPSEIVEAVRSKIK